MPRVIVAGSENSPSFAVIDFTNPAVPSVVLVNPGFGGGCHVTVGGTHAVAGNVLGGQVRMVNVANPAAPVLQGTATLTLAGIGALAIRGSLVAAGESQNSFQARVVLIDFSNPMAPVVLGTAATSLASAGNPAIGSLAFISDRVVLVSGPSDFQIVQVDFTNPAAPVVSNFNPTLAGPPVIDADASAALLAAGDSTSGILKFFNASTKAPLGSINTTFPGITSVAAASPLLLVASANDFNAQLINVSGPTKTAFNPGLGGGSVTAIEGTTGACGAILGSNVALVNLSGTPTLLGTANATIPSISTLSISTFAGGGPQISLSTAALSFGAVLVNTSAALPITLHNPGTASLSVSTLASSNSRFTFSPAGPFNIGAGGSQLVQVTFTPNQEAAFNATLSMNTNDPANAVVNVPLSGTGGRPHIGVSPSTLDLGSVPVCLSRSSSINVHNSGSVPLHVASATTSGAPFSVSPSTLSVAASATLPIIVQYTPSAVGPANGTLTINSDDAANPSIVIPLSGNGLPTPPPALAVSPGSLNFGATPVQFYIGLRIAIANTSPCQMLTVRLTSNGAPFFVTDADPTTLPPGSLTVSGSVAANSSKKFVVAFAPTAIGAAVGTLTITSNDPNNPTVTVPLSGNGVLLSPASIELVLDRSGSMSAPAQSGTKMDGLKAAVQLFADLGIQGQGDEMGSVEFDDVANVLTPFGPFDAAKQNAIKNDANGLTPRNHTSIGAGLQVGLAELAAATTSRKVILVFTDGLENTPPTIAAVEPAIAAANAEVYAVGLGQPQNISAAALSALATSSNGHFFQTDDTLILRKNFVQVLADAFRHNMAADPVLNLPQGGVIDVPVAITDCERRITFVVNFDNLASQVDVTIIAPDNTQLTPNSPNGSQLVRYGERPGYRYYQIAFPPLDPGSGLTIGPRQLGTWLVRLRGTALAGASERCTTSVMVESQLELRGTVQAVDTSTPIQAEALLLGESGVVTNAEVTLTVTAPTKSLAAVSTPAVVFKALDADNHPIAAGLAPLIPVVKTKHRLTLGHGGRTFTAQLPPPEIDGVYEFEFQARGKACGGDFDRYRTLSEYIGKRPDHGKTSVRIEPSGPGAAVVTIMPRDAHGHLLGSGLSRLIRAEMSNGTAQAAVDLRNGSYAVRVVWPVAGREPELILHIGEFAIPVSLGRQPSGS